MSDKRKPSLADQADTTVLLEETLEELRELQARARLDDATTSQYKNQIDVIFQIVSLLENNAEGDVNDMYYLLDHELPTPSIISITSLAIQLNKLRLLDSKLRTDSIIQAAAQLQTRIVKLEDRKSNIEQELDQIRLKLLKKEAEIIRVYEEGVAQVNSHIEDYKLTKIKQVEVQALKLQYANFKIIYETSFQQKDKKLSFNHQPILKLEEFLGYNLLVINQFLERLIILQSQLSYLFNVDLPHLKELMNYVPDEKFYNLIRKKELMISGREADEEEENRIEEQSSEKRNSMEIPKGIPNPTEKIFKLGDGYNLPPSSKTLNYQLRRRASSVEPADLNNIPVIKEPTAATSSSSKTSSRKIIIPHKIINKPFNKLAIKDFLKFVGIIVKIIINFQAFLVFTSNESELQPDEWCNFYKVLREITKLDKVLKDNIVKETVSRPVTTLLSTDLEMRANFQVLMEQVYEKLMTSSYSRKQHNRPIALQDLNLKNLIFNQTKLSDDWDIVSGML
ncbi:hypothetical protein Cantr_09216 [Candida viswanathii]|uniref:Uncharacterized protein n=1 Tax=Candida viswanathii TaxID=5486 RepID=A0A367Y952_9ASCO|nr:hypothetical protein Cantr_09216 [Candida viswanathii]